MALREIAIDRRSARTRARLHEALMSLILERGYERVTIKDICEAANVARSTFYAHYTSKDDLKRGGLDILRRSLLGQCRADPVRGKSARQRLGFSLALFEHARDHIGHYRALVGGHGGDVALGRIRQIVSDLMRKELAAATGREAIDAMSRELAVTFLVGAYMAVLTWWLDGGVRLPARRVDEMCRRLAIDGIAANWTR